MNNWKEHANLFANGRFRVNVAETVAEIMAYHNRYSAFDLYSKEHMEWEYNCELNRCTLIARRIEDMSEEEIATIMGETEFGGTLEKVKQKAGCWGLPLDQSLVLCRFGIYPGPQSHFDLPDGHEAKVIDIKTI